MGLGSDIIARFTFKGAKEYAIRLSKLGEKSRQVGGKAIYKAAGVVADGIRKEIDALPIRSGYGSPEKPLRGVTEKGKKGLQEGLGISSIEDNDGLLNVKIGFDGYNSVKTKKYPQGQPNQLVARGVESGTSWLVKIRFVSKGVSKSRKTAEQIMNNTINEETEKIMKG